MPYYQGDYYQGDYYQGDLFGFLKKGFSAVTGLAGSILPGPIGGLAKLASRVTRGQASRSTLRAAQARQVQASRGYVQPTMARQPMIIPKPGGSGIQKMGYPEKRRRMNVTNDKALRRAIRRTNGFVKLAKKALKGSGYKVVSKGSGGKRIVVKEAGAGSVNIQ